MSIQNIPFPNSFQSNSNSEEPSFNKVQSKKVDPTKGVELLTTENIKNIPYECTPGECAPLNNGKCYPDH